MQRNPIWQVDVSTACACLAAGRAWRQHVQQGVRAVFRVGSNFGECHLAGVGDELRELAIGDWTVIDPEIIHRDAVRSRSDGAVS